MNGFFDEMLENEDAGGARVMRGPYADYGHWFNNEDPERVHQKAAQAEAQTASGMKLPLLARLCVASRPERR